MIDRRQDRLLRTVSVPIFLVTAASFVGCAEDSASFLPAITVDAATREEAVDGGQAAREVAITFGDAVVQTVSPRFLSVAVDASQVVGGKFWTPDGETVEGLGSENVPSYDFSRPRLMAAAAALSPGYLRIGGSEADKIFYDLSDDPVEEAPEPYELVLTKAQFEGVADFANALDFRIFFTLNAGPGPRDADSNWEDDNARELVSWVQREGHPVDVWELGNEINGFQAIHGIDFRIDGRQYAADMAVARAMIDELDPDTPLAGPSSAFWPRVGELAAIYPTFMREGGHLVDIVTWHYYPQQSERCPLHSVEALPGVLMQPAALDELRVWADHVEEHAADHAPQAEIWLGETGNAQCGGQPGISDRFEGTFWWLDELGQLARRGQKVVVRQTLSGSNYGLLNDQTLEANPDYFASVLWKRLMGSRVLAATSDDAMVRTYAHCAPRGSGATAVVLNLRDEPVTAAVAIDTPVTQVWEATADALDAPTLRINGTTAVLRSDGSPPPLDPRLDDRRITIAPLSWAFVHVRSLPACAK